MLKRSIVLIIGILFLISGCSSMDNLKELAAVEEIKADHKILQGANAPGVQYNTIEYLTKWYEVNGIEVVSEENAIYQEFQQEIARSYESYQFVEFANGNAVLMIYFSPGWGPEPNRPEIVKEAAEIVVKKTEQKYLFDNNYINWTVLFSDNIETMMDYYSECESGRYPVL